MNAPSYRRGLSVSLGSVFLVLALARFADHLGWLSWMHR